MKKALCKILGHHFVKTNNDSKYSDEYECAHCKQQFTKDGYGRIVKLTSFWVENNRLFENHLSRKSS